MTIKVTPRIAIMDLLGLVEQLRRIIGLSLDEAIKLNPLQTDDLAVPRFLVDCINIIDQGKEFSMMFVFVFE